MSHSPANPTKRALYFKGPNPTADIVLFRPAPTGVEVLLIVRSRASNACPGLPAFPGGFVDAVDEKADFHHAKETPEEAGRRELTEETGLVAGKDTELLACGVWEAPWRDPRNSPDSFARSHLFCAWVPEGFGPNPQSLDDAEPGKTAWVNLASLSGTVMAFDHGCMLSSACAKLGIPDPGARSWSQDLLWERLDARRCGATVEACAAKPNVP